MDSKEKPGVRILTNGEYYSSAELFLLKRLLLYADQPKTDICLNDLITLFEKRFYHIFAIPPIPPKNPSFATELCWFYADSILSKHRVYNVVLRWLQNIHEKGGIVFTCPKLFEEDFVKLYERVSKVFGEGIEQKPPCATPESTHCFTDEELMRAQTLADRLSGETLREMEAEPDPDKPLSLEFTDKGTKLIRDSLDCYLDWFVDEGYRTVQKAEGKFLYPRKAISVLRKVIHNACDNYQTEEIDITLNMHFRSENKDQQQPDWFIEPEIQVIETLLSMERDRVLTIRSMDRSQMTVNVDEQVLSGWNKELTATARFSDGESAVSTDTLEKQGKSRRRRIPEPKYVKKEGSGYLVILREYILIGKISTRKCKLLDALSPFEKALGLDALLAGIKIDRDEERNWSSLLADEYSKRQIVRNTCKEINRILAVSKPRCRISISIWNRQVQCKIHT